MVGRKPLPTSLHVLHGNPSKKDLSKPEPKPAPIMPKCPAILDAGGKREWKRVATELHNLGLLTIIDATPLAAYCDAVSLWEKCARAIKRHYKDTGTLTCKFTNKAGGVNEVPIPEIAIAKSALATVKAFCVEFGLTPSSRARMTLPGQDPEEDPMELLLRKAGG